MTGQSSSKTLWDLARQKSAIVVGVSSALEPSYRQRLLDFGVEAGVEVLCLRHTLFGGPRVYQVRGFCVSFEKKIADHILVGEEL